MSIGTYIVDTSEIGDTYTMFGFRNSIEGANITGAAEDAGYPMVNATDNRDDTEASMDSTGTLEQFVSFQTIQKVNYFGLLSKNGATSGASLKVEVFDLDTAAYVEVLNTTFGSDGEPSIVYFGDQSPQNYFNAQQLKITYTLTSKLYITAMACGFAEVLSQTPDLGYQPAKLGILDKTSNNKTQGNNFTLPRRTVLGYQAKGRISYIRFSDLVTWWGDYQQHVKSGKFVYFFVNSGTPIDSIIGKQAPNTITKPVYEPSGYTSVDIEINGYS